MQTQRHFVVQVEDVVRIQRSEGTFCEDFQLDKNQITKSAHTTTNDFPPSQGNAMRVLREETWPQDNQYGNGVACLKVNQKEANHMLASTQPIMMPFWMPAKPAAAAFSTASSATSSAAASSEAESSSAALSSATAPAAAPTPRKKGQTLLLLCVWA